PDAARAETVIGAPIHKLAPGGADGPPSPPRREHTFPASEIVGHRSAGNEPPSAGDGNGPPAADGANNGRGDSNGKEDSKDTSATDVNAADGGVATKST